MQFREWRSSGGIAVTIYNTLRVHKGEAKKFRIFRTSPCVNMEIFVLYIGIGDCGFNKKILLLIVVNTETIIYLKRDWSNESPTDTNLIKYYYNCTRFISNVKLQLHNGNAHGTYHP